MPSFPAYGRRWRGARRALAAAAGALLLAAAPAAPAQWFWSRAPLPAPPAGVDDPFYGDVLFHFFQTRYFSAVTSLMVSQQFARMPAHADEAEVLRGGLFLSYGLHREAGDIFARLIERGAPPPVRDRAWYYLARIRYQRGLDADAQQALDRIAAPLPAELEEDRQLLAAQLAMQRGDYAAAAARLAALAQGSSANQYARFNLGVALLRGGDARGSALLDEVGQLKTDSDELRNLRDRANVALGFADLQRGDLEPARRRLQRVRLEGMLANRALLGFGWAAAEEKRLDAALVPWTELARRDPADPAVLEARLAVPYAYGELGAPARALALYEEAIAAFAAEEHRIDDSIAAIRGGALLAGLVERNPGEEMGWFWNIDDLPEIARRAPLAAVLAQHAFQEAFKNWRDLQFLARNLQQWDESLGTLRDMLDQRRRAFADKLPAVRTQRDRIDLDALAARRDALRDEMARVEREADVAALADARERELQARLDRVRASVGRADAPPEAAAARERYRLVAGALRWQQTQAFVDRLWRTTKTLRDLNLQVEQAQARAVALAHAQETEPARLAAFAARIDALAQRLGALRPQLAQLAAEQQTAVQDMAVAELQRQKERLAGYTTQARFAVAQLYDRGAAAQEGPRAPAP